jgi:putative effector of murein hydrolase LrgA (UPF0299 family)
VTATPKREPDLIRADESLGSPFLSGIRADARLRLHLVEPATREDVGTPAAALHPSLLQRWHLLSLDAPCVATLWLCFIAQCAGVSLRWTSPAAMFVAVWMLYVADRLLDARPTAGGEAPQGLEERHRFHQRHRHGFLTCFVVASIALAALLHTLPAAALHLYMLLAALLTSWLLLVHVRAASAAQRLPKELAVALFFPAAVCIPTVAREPALRAALLLPAILFAAVCALNCLYIFAWEHPSERTSAHWSTCWGCRHLTALCTAAIAAALTAAAVYARTPALHALTPLLLASSGSAACLLVLDHWHARLDRVQARALADVALLTPLAAEAVWLCSRLR